MGSRGVTTGYRERGRSEPTKTRAASSDREDTHGHREQRNGSEKKVR